MGQTHISEALEAAMERAHQALQERWKKEAEESGRPAELSPRDEAFELAWTRSGVFDRYLWVAPATKPTTWAYITGPVGSGKTYGACAMLRRFLSDGMEELAPGCWHTPVVKFTTASDYLELMRCAKADRTDAERVAVMRKADCLVIDDLGQENPTRWAVERLYDVINDRYNSMLPTVVTSQYPVGGIAARLGANGGAQQAEAIARRLEDECRVYQLTERYRGGAA